jgi:hypothetical protein
MRIGTWRTAENARDNDERGLIEAVANVFDLSNPQVWTSHACAMMREELTGCFCHVTAQ